MDASTILAVLPGAGPHQRLQVVLNRARGARSTIELHEQHYAEGIGWYHQRTLSMSVRQFKQLRAIFGNKEAAWEAEDDLTLTLPFTGSMVGTEPRRVAAGE